MTDLKTSLVIVDEVHGIDRSRASHDQQHRLFYQHMLTVLGVDDWTRRTASIRGFGSLPDDIREQAGWAASSATPSGARSRRPGLRARSRSSTSPTPTSAPPLRDRAA